MLQNSAIIIAMTMFKEDGNSIFWKKMWEKEVKGSGKMLNIEKGTITIRFGRSCFRTYRHSKASSATYIFAVNCTVKKEEQRSQLKYQVIWQDLFYKNVASVESSIPSMPNEIVHLL